MTAQGEVHRHNIGNIPIVECVNENQPNIVGVFSFQDSCLAQAMPGMNELVTQQLELMRTFRSCALSPAGVSSNGQCRKSASERIDKSPIQCLVHSNPRRLAAG